MKLWSDFYDLILPDLPGCSPVMADVALRQSAIAFCEQSLAWKYEHPPISIVSGTAEYGFFPPAGALVHAVIHAELDGRELNCSTSEADIRIAGWHNQSGAPQYILGGANFLALVPKPDARGTLTLETALKPAPSAAGIDDSLFDEYREAIIHGALARLMLSPRKPYTNVQLAQYHAQQFVIQAADAGTRAARSHTRAPLQTRMMRRV